LREPVAVFPVVIRQRHPIAAPDLAPPPETPRRPAHRHRPLALAALAAASACNPGGPLPISAPTAASALAADKAPLVVDWPAGPRADLEAATQEGVVVVKVEPSNISLLRDCRLSGSYGFLGVTTKEQLIRLEDAGEMKLSLPLRGAAFAADLSGELGASTALDVALVTVGKRRTTRATAPRGALKGSECAGATHFVRGFDVGAFVLATSEKSNASTVAGLFGAKGSYAHKGGKSVREVDGSLDACKSGKPGDAQPPPQCGAVLRLELKALDEDEGAAADDSCGAGFVRAAGKCTARAKAAAKAVAYECSPSDEAECEAQCNAGNAASCGHYARALRNATAKAPDFARARAAAERGCEGGSERACVVVGELLQYGNGVAADKLRAGALYDRACGAGDAFGCFRLGMLYDHDGSSANDLGRAAELYDRACRGGFVDGCNNLGAMALRGRGVDASPSRAREIYDAACKNGSAFACGNLGDLFAGGVGGPEDPARAGELWAQACPEKGDASGTHCVRLGSALSDAKSPPNDDAKGGKKERATAAYERGVKVLAAQCNLGLADRCADLGAVYHDGRAVPRDDAKAYALFKQGCEAGSAAACHYVGASLAEGWGVPKNADEAKKKFGEACAAGELRACVRAALAAYGDERASLLDRACAAGAAEGCFYRARGLRTADAGGRDKARELLDRACRGGHGAACSYLGRWGQREGVAADEAAKAFEAGCAKGDPSGCVSLAEALAPGARTDADRDRVESLARRGCDAGVGRGCGLLAGLAPRGQAPEGAAAQRVSLLEKACKADDYASCVRLGLQFLQADPGRAASYFRGACDASAVSSSALVELMRSGTVERKTSAVSNGGGPVGGGIVLQQSSLRAGGAGLGSVGSTGRGAGSTGGRSEGSPPPPGPDVVSRLAVKKLSPSQLDAIDAFEAAEGAQSGCAQLGSMAEQGVGLNQSKSSALRYYAASCSTGHASGCTRLGALLLGDKPKNDDTPRMLFARACQMGDGEACLKRGLLQASSRDADERGEALESFDRACKLGSGEGCFRAGAGHAAQRGADYLEAAAAAYARACEYKEARGCVAAAKMLERSYAGKPADKPAAARLREKACELGDKAACRR
jgi:TPR repeat protein